MFLRFVIGGDDEDHRQLTGLITEAELLRKQGMLAAYEEELLQDAFTWFNHHLPCPPFSSAHWPRDTASWFKDSAKAPIQRMYALVALLQSHGLWVRTLYSRNPGKVLYEDDYQVVVLEWKQL